MHKGCVFEQPPNFGIFSVVAQVQQLSCFCSRLVVQITGPQIGFRRRSFVCEPSVRVMQYNCIFFSTLVRLFRQFTVRFNDIETTVTKNNNIVFWVLTVETACAMLKPFLTIVTLLLNTLCIVCCRHDQSILSLLAKHPTAKQKYKLIVVPDPSQYGNNVRNNTTTTPAVGIVLPQILEHTRSSK